MRDQAAIRLQQRGFYHRLCPKPFENPAHSLAANSKQLGNLTEREFFNFPQMQDLFFKRLIFHEAA